MNLKVYLYIQIVYNTVSEHLNNCSILAITQLIQINTYTS